MSTRFNRSRAAEGQTSTTAAGESAVERRTQEIGLRLMSRWRSHQRGIGSLRRGLSDKLMDWAMSDPQFKIQLFRFVDVFPTLRNPAQIHSVLLEYLRQPGVVMPSGLEWGLKASGAMKGVLARTISANIQHMAETFIAGRNATDALPQLRRNWQHNVAFSIDLLGEACLSEREADAYRQRYLQLLRGLSDEVARWPANRRLEADHLGPIPRANVSIKISSLSSHLKVEDFAGSLERLYASLEPILLEAAKRNVLINFDMEQFEWKDLTIGLFQRCCERIDFPAGLALQAYLRSGPSDAEQLSEWARGLGRPVTVRLIKGAYWDYEVIHAQTMGWPIPVWTYKSDTDACFERMTQQLLDARPAGPDGGGIRLALGSHNVRSIAHALACVETAGLPASALEFQLLEGMAQSLRQTLVEEGYRVRAYVPLGELIPGMAYLVRRLLENTSNESWLRGSEIAGRTDEQLLAAPLPTQREGDLQPSSQSSAGTAPHGLAPIISQLADGRPFVNEPLRDFADAAQRQSFARAIDLARAKGLANPVQFVTVEAARQAVERAKASVRAWSETDVVERARALLKTAERFRQQRDELASLVILEAGKTWREADADICEAIDFCEYYARQAVDMFGPHRLGTFLGELNEATYLPRGVAAVISPWNFPLAICCGMTVASLVTGNATLVKPAEQTSRIGERLCQALWESGVPKDVLQFLPGPGETIGAQLVQNPDVALIAFTGSREVGFQILRTAGDVTPQHPTIKKVVCEMGGKNAIVVDSTADLDEAVAGVCRSAFVYAGQKCSACSRAIVVESIYEPFLQRLIEMTRSLTLGEAHDPATDLGPVIDRAAAEKIEQYIQLGRDQNTLALEVAVPPALDHAVEGRLIGPHIFRDVQPDDTLAREEIFGPVLVVILARSFEEALQLANRSPYRLTGAVYSRTPSHLEAARRRFHVGNLYLNRGSTGALVGRQPFGGFGHSGKGIQAGGPDYLRQFVNSQIICENTLRRGFAPDLT
jgi:RHH-type proline utilization regulon transcriptional repressor/proline dehydrogenase/delta 1-pyrroline-5-carboxylate dehydrogenase